MDVITLRITKDNVSLVLGVVHFSLDAPSPPKIDGHPASLVLPKVASTAIAVPALRFPILDDKAPTAVTPRHPAIGGVDEETKDFPVRNVVNEVIVVAVKWVHY